MRDALWDGDWSSLCKEAPRFCRPQRANHQIQGVVDPTHPLLAIHPTRISFLCKEPLSVQPMLLHKIQDKVSKPDVPRVLNKLLPCDVMRYMEIFPSFEITKRARFKEMLSNDNQKSSLLPIVVKDFFNFCIFRTFHNPGSDEEKSYWINPNSMPAATHYFRLPLTNISLWPFRR